MYRLFFRLSQQPLGPAGVYILLYTARSQHAEIENSHSQRGKSEQALLKLYSNFFSHPPEAR